MSEIQSEDLVAVDETDGPALKTFLKANNVSLTVDEFARVCVLLGRKPTTVELHIFNTMWSEHCSYKSSKPTLGEFLPTEAPHVVLGPGEDAGIIRFAEIDGRSVCLVMAHESHNHPSQVLPVEGAATGIGGIVRDVYCMGADVIGVMDPLRFGDPDGPNGARVRDIAWGVVDGIAQYGNALGVPNFGGETYFDASYDDNCLVNVVAFGILDEDGVIHSRVPDEAHSEPYDVILVGKPTDASGFGGAAFASERLSEEEAVERQGAVQVPDPFLKRVLAEAGKEMLAWAKNNNIPIGYKDLGAGGICCAVSEMAEAAGMGVDVNLDHVRVAVDDMLPEVISCSETQERFLIAVPANRSHEVIAIYNEHFELPKLYAGAGASVIGRVTEEKRFRVSCSGKVVSDADVEAVTTGILYDRPESKTPRIMANAGLSHSDNADGYREVLLTLIKSVNISDKSSLYQHYDSEVQARAVLRPGEADAAVAMMVAGSPVALVAAIGSNSRLGAVDPYLGGVWAVVESVRNVACVGGMPLAITDCLNYGDPEDPGVFHEFREGVKGIGDACRGLKIEGDYGIPVVSGNVSFYNQSETGSAIFPTPIVACAGRLDNASVARNLGFKRADSHIVLLGRLHENIAGSEYDKYYGAPDGATVPTVDFKEETRMIQALIEAFDKGLVNAAHDIGHGGILIAVAEMILGSAPFDVGADLDLTGVLNTDANITHQLFSELGGIIVEVPADLWDAFSALMDSFDISPLELGRTTEAPSLEVSATFGKMSSSLNELKTANAGNIESILYS